MGKGYIRNAKIEESPLQGDLMLFDPVKSQFYVLNPTMAFVWKSCEGAMGLDDMVTAMTGEFDEVSPTAAKSDLQAALGNLVTLGLVSES